MRGGTCLFCGGDLGARDHWAHCDGKQGYVEHAIENLHALNDDGFGGRTGTNHPDTSHEAPEGLALSTLRQHVLALLVQHGPINDFELLRLFRLAFGTCGESTPRARRSELVELGFVEFDGTYDVLPNGRRTRRWRIVQREVTR